MSTPFKIDVPAAKVEQLRAAFDSADLSAWKANLLNSAASASVEDFSFGISVPLFERLIERVKNGYDWSEWQSKLNSFGEHYRVTISNVPDEGELSLHYIVCRSARADAVPLSVFGLRGFKLLLLNASAADSHVTGGLGASSRCTS